MRIRFFLILVALAGSAHAAVSPLGVTPDAGPHAVGLRVVQQYDYSRTLDAPVDVFGKAGAVGPARPIQTLVWYPAKRTSAAPMQVVDYRHISLSEADFALSNADAAKQRANWLQGPQKAQYAATTLAVRDAAPAGGNYPVVIYAPGMGGPAHENMDLCEYLASHGYVVIASRSLGPRAFMMTADVEGIEAQAADIAFLANFAQTLPQADITKVAAAGFSWGGMANVFAAARSNRIKALVSLDGSIRYHPKIWGAASYVQPASTAVPMMFLGAGTPTPERMERDDKMGASYLNKMVYSDLYVTNMPAMTHMNFSSFALRFAPDNGFGDYQRADVLHGSRSGALYAHRFLDAYLKNDAKALAFLKQSPARHGIGPQVMSMEFRPASAVSYGEADFVRAFAKAQHKDAQALYTQMVTQSPGFKLHPVNLNLMGYQLLQAKNAQAAVQLFKLATHIEPKYGDAFDSEGEAYEALGETALAIAAYEKAVAADAKQVNAIARIKALKAGQKG